MHMMTGHAFVTIKGIGIITLYPSVSICTVCDIIWILELMLRHNVSKYSTINCEEL